MTEVELLREELRRVREEARVNSEMFQLVIDNIPQLIFWKDRQSRYLGCNENMARNTGMTKQAVVGQTDYEMAWGETEAEQYRAADRRVMDADKGEYRIVETQLCSDGSIFYCETNKIPLHDVTGEVIGILGTSEDVTDRHKLQEQLRSHSENLERLVQERTRELGDEVRERQAAEQELVLRAAELDHANQNLLAAEKMKSEFFANVSHELRTPLTLLIAPLESLKTNQYGALPEKAAGILEMMHSNAVRLLEMVNGLLDFSRLEAGHVRVRPEPLPLSKMVEGIVHDFRMAGAARGQQVTWNGPETSTVRMSDSFLFVRIVFNLLSNALKFTPENGLIEVNYSEEGDEVRFSVRDSGIGISEMDQQQLFRRFYQVEGSANRRFEGTGLGLAMVQEFAQLLGGDASVKSELGVGSCFSVRLLAPVTDQEPAGVAKKIQVTGPAVAPVNRAEPVASVHIDGPHILLAEDNPDLAKFVCDLLSEVGNVRWARNGLEALEMIGEFKPDLILSDVMMPELDGLSLCRQLKASLETREIPLVMLTAQTQRAALMDGWEAGADEYLFKPFHPLELMTRVRSLLKKVAADKAHNAEKTRLEHALAHSRKLESLGVMAGGIAHDFNNLLAVVLGQINLVAADYTTSPEDVKECLAEAEEATRKAAELTRQMLTYAGRAPQKKEFVDLSTMVPKTAALIKGLLRSAQVQFELAPAGLDGDRSQIEQVFVNLMTNAAEALTDRESPSIRVSTGRKEFDSEFLAHEAQPGLYSYLCVEDNGQGMDEASVEKMFDPFYTTKFTGRGLGLASVAGILRGQKGHVRVFSKLGVGTTIWVLWPAVIPEAPKEAAPKGPLWSGTGKVLLIDDEAAVRKIGSKMLSRLGFNVLEAEHGEAGLEAFNNHCGDLKAVLIDIILPDQDGRRLVPKMRAVGPDVPLLLCSGYWGEAPADSEPGVPFLVKPYDMSSLRNAMSNLLDNKS